MVLLEGSISIAQQVLKQVAYAYNNTIYSTYNTGYLRNTNNTVLYT